MDIVLIAGLWLDASVWDNVAAQLEARGHRAVPVTLPGQGDGNASATLADQVATVVAAVRLADQRRYDVPVAVVCPEFTPAQAREWIGHGEVPELTKSKNVSFLNIDSGHWPMISAPAELARLLAQAAEQA